jgi:hypothetical protein
LLAAAVLLGALGIALVAGRAHLAPPGPLQPPPDEPAASVGVPIDPGARVSVGILSVENPRDASVTIRDVRLVGADPELHLVGTLLVPDWATEIGSVYGFPVPHPPSLLHIRHPPSAPGAHVPPAPGRTAIILGLSVSAPGRWAFHAVEIDYESGGRSYRAVYPVSAELCAPRRLFSRGCDEAVAPARA